MLYLLFIIKKEPLNMIELLLIVMPAVVIENTTKYNDWLHLVN